MVNYTHAWASLVAQPVKNLPAVQETWVQSLGWEDPLEEEMATTVHGIPESDVTERVTFTFIHKPVPGTSPRQDGPSAAVPSEGKRVSALSLFNVPDLPNMLQLIDEHISCSPCWSPYRDTCSVLMSLPKLDQPCPLGKTVFSL